MFYFAADFPDNLYLGKANIPHYTIPVDTPGTAY